MKRYSKKRFLLFIILCFATILLGRVSYRTYKHHIRRERYKQKLKAREQLIEELEKYNKDHIKDLKRRLPRAVGIGVKKCGTDGVLSFLLNHPLVQAPYGLETFHFMGKYDKGPESYRVKMPETNARQMAIEKTPVYFGAPPHNLPQRVKNTLPGVKLFLIVCDPTARAFSDYIHEVASGKSRKYRPMRKYSSFEKYVEEYLPVLQSLTEDFKGDETSPGLSKRLVNLFKTDKARATFLSNGIYSPHFERWRHVFNESSLMVIDGDRFLEDPGRAIEALQDFLGLPKVILREDFVRHPDTRFFCYRRKNLNDTRTMGDVCTLKCLPKTKGRTRNQKREADPETLKTLRDFYEPFNRAFFRQLGREFKW